MEDKTLRILCERTFPLDESIGKPITLKGKTNEYEGRIVLLSELDIPRIIDLEEKTNIPSIRASKEKILLRFEKRNMMLGFEIDNEYFSQQRRLIGDLAWRFTYFNPERLQDLPDNFEEYSTPNYRPPANFNTMFHYGINIDSKMRTEGLGRQVCKYVFEAMFNQGKKSGCDFVVFDPRLHTYNGSDKYPEIEKFPQDPKMREAVDKAIKGEREFTLQDALRDPAFNVYNRLLGPVEFIKLMPDTWFPPDKPSGGFGIYCYKKL